MRLIIPGIEIDSSEPFKNDILNRKSFADSMSKLISTANDGLVLSIDAPWGEGKTTFVRMWDGMLKMNGFSSIYFDAFVNDFIDDPFVAIVSKVVSFVEHEVESNNDAKDNLERFKKAACKIGGKLLSFGARVGIKAATLGIIKEADIQILDSIKQDLAKGTGEFIERIIEERISSYKKDYDSIVKFRELLESLAKSTGTNTGKPLVFIIDELDRCKPTYAIDLIEKVKHLFSVKSIVFVLVIHKAQMEEYVRCIYGANVDANSYLQKFINIECHLPKQIEPDMGTDYELYCKHLYNQHEFAIADRENDIIAFASIFGSLLHLTLRQLEISFNYLVILHSIGARFREDLSPIYVFLSIIKATDPNLFLMLKFKRLPFGQLLNQVKELSKLDNSIGDYRMKYAFSMLKYCLLTDDEYSKLDKNDMALEIGPSLVRFRINRNDIIPKICKLLDMVSV